MIPDAVFTLDKAKAHLRVTHALEDALITAFLDAAVAAAERVTRRAWTAREWSTPVDACDIDGCDCGTPYVFHALLSPATAEVFNVAAGPVETPLPASDYYLSHRYGHTVLRLHQWSVAHGDEGAIGRIDWSAAPPDDAVPPDVYAAVMLYLGDLYANRESQITGVVVVPNAMADMLLRPYVVELHL